MKVLPFLVVTAITVTSCYYDEVIKVEEPVEGGDMSFTEDIVPIFNKSCNVSGCHNGSVAPNLLPANAYNALTSGNYVNTGDPESSELYQWVKGNKAMPMPLTGSNESYNAKILAWIKQGASNN
jgi:hypothetical protein